MSTTTLHKVTKNTLMPQLRFKEFEYSNINSLTIASLLIKGRKITYGIVQPGEYDSEGVIMIRSQDYSNGWNHISTYYKVSKLVDKPYERSRVLSGDIVITVVGGNVGKIEVIPEYLHQSNISRSVARISVQHELASPGFIKFYLQNKIKKLVAVNQVGGAQPVLNLKELEKFKAFCPSLAEQQKIASFLSAVDEKIQQLTRKKELLEQYKKGVMQQLFSGKLRFKDENGIDFPEWEEKKLGCFLTHKSKKNKDLKIELVLSVSNKKGFISQNEQFDGYEVASKDLSNYKIVKKDDFAYNPSRINVGSIARLINFENGIVSPMYVVFSLKNGLDNVYFENLYNTHRFKHLIKVGCSGSVRDSLNFEDLANFKFKFPCLEEQKKIADFLSSIDVKLENVNQQVNQAQNFKKGLLQQLFV